MSLCAFKSQTFLEWLFFSDLTTDQPQNLSKDQGRTFSNLDAPTACVYLVSYPDKELFCDGNRREVDGLVVEQPCVSY